MSSEYEGPRRPWSDGGYDYAAWERWMAEQMTIRYAHADWEHTFDEISPAGRAILYAICAGLHDDATRGATP